MMTFAPGDVVWVPFPHVETDRIAARPALIVSNSPLGSDGMLVWALMITNAARQDWPGDIMIDDYVAAGLNHPSKIRTAKLATLDAKTANKLGSIGRDLTMQVHMAICGWIAPSNV
jgi:mRNA interferase MazF